MSTVFFLHFQITCTVKIGFWGSKNCNQVKSMEKKQKLEIEYVNQSIAQIFS